MIPWMLANEKDNPLYTKFDRVAAILKKYDVVLSPGNGIRAGAIRRFELGLFGPLAKRIRASRTPEDRDTCTKPRLGRRTGRGCP